MALMHLPGLTGHGPPSICRGFVTEYLLNVSHLSDDPRAGEHPGSLWCDRRKCPCVRPQEVPLGCFSRGVPDFLTFLFQDSFFANKG